MEDGEIVAAVRSLRAERRYPVPLTTLARRLHLGARQRVDLTERLLAGSAPEGLAVLRRGNRVLLTLEGEQDVDRPLRVAERVDLRIRLADLERRQAESPAGAATPDDFEPSFDDAYDRLAREERSPFVPLPSLRAALPAYQRAEFDGALVALCVADRYQLSEHEHPGRLPEEARAAALVRGGRSYWFVSRV